MTGQETRPAGGQREVDHVDDFAPHNRMRVRFTMARGTVLAFTVQDEVQIDDRFYPVVRYDTAHGFAHRDSLDWHGEVIRKEPLPPDMTYNDGLTFAQRDIQRRWPAYRTEFLGGDMSTTASAVAQPTDEHADELTGRVIDLSIGLTGAILADPTIADSIPHGVHLSLVPDDDPAVATRVLELGINALHNGENVYFVHVQHAADGTLNVKRNTPLVLEGEKETKPSR